MERRAHWDQVYIAKADRDLSWHQEEPAVSLRLILELSGGAGRIIDVGGGASLLVDRLLSAGFHRPAVLDISPAALERARNRLGQRSAEVEWIVADVTAMPDLGVADLWHDRAVFHFLTAAEDRRRYADLAACTVRPGGHLVLATFAPDGPTQCSGLDTCRYDAAGMASELGPAFTLLREQRETHLTPWGKTQPFHYGVFRRTTAKQWEPAHA